MVTVGRVTSRVHVADGGLVSTTPPEIARTVNVCAPSVTVVMNGVVLAANAPVSSLHSKVSGETSALKVNVAAGVRVTIAGRARIVVLGPAPASGVTTRM